MIAGEWKTLLAAATIANGGLPDALALTDPSLYRRLRAAVTLFHLKGYGAMSMERLRGNAMSPKADVGGP